MTQWANVTLRPETEEDKSFLLELFISTREQAFGFGDLSPTDRTPLLREQFELQHGQYKLYPHAWFTIIIVANQPAGRLYVSQSPKEMRVIDLSLLPAYQNKGIGSQLLKNLQAEATRTQLPLRLYVDNLNPAYNFYTRLGFRRIGETASHIHMQWNHDQC
ncbi:MAG: GNAT family N-acetyltransferase [Puniceicoccaceae bacterium]